MRGRLTISRMGEGGDSEGRFRTIYVPGSGYDGMEDNDIRGLLDGTFLYGWNQVGQKYVRAGRLDDVFKYGEYELFRILHRWGGLAVPPGATVEDVELRLYVRPDHMEGSRSLFLYGGRRDWDPGSGGVDRDNISPPREGSVWWNHARFGEEEWGLPGGSSDEDFDPSPLARATIEAGDPEVAFRTSALARYVAECVEADQPALFLIKLQDRQEDIPGSLIYLWSATEGEDRTQGRKPRLSLWWSSPSSVVEEVDVALEHGRSRIMGVEGGTRVDFSPAEGSESPVIEAREEGGAWRRVEDGQLGPEEVELRVRAVRSPISLGSPFVASFRDTWVRTGPPERQNVPWLFISPTGRELTLMARYEGDYTWVLEFTPDEVGRWRYSWGHDFQVQPYLSQVETFDVVVESFEDAVLALRHFLSLVLADGFDDREALSRMMVRFSKVERAALAVLTPADFRGERGGEIRALIREIRGAFGSPVPEVIPLEAAEPHPWEGD